MIGNKTHANQTKYPKFKRGENGELDLENGEYSKDNLTYLKVEYEDEIRLALGCAIVSVDGVDFGRRCHSVVYSGKTIVSIKDYNKRIAVEIQRVKQLTGKGPGYWVMNPRPPGVLYADDSLEILKGCGEKRL